MYICSHVHAHTYRYTRTHVHINTTVYFAFCNGTSCFSVHLIEMVQFYCDGGVHHAQCMLCIMLTVRMECKQNHPPVFHPLGTPATTLSLCPTPKPITDDEADDENFVTHIIETLFEDNLDVL